MLEFGQKVSSSANTVDLFAAGGTKIKRTEPPYPDIPDWLISKRLASEKETLGFYVSGHPLDRYRAELAAFGTIDTARLMEVKDGREVRFGGIISALKVMNDKRGNRMAFATVEDFKGKVELILFSDCYDKGKAYIIEDNMIMLTGRVSTREGEAPKVIVSDIFPLESLSERFNCQLVIRIDEETTERKLNAIQGTLEKNQGKTPVIFAVRKNGEEYLIKSNRFMVTPENKLLLKLKEILGESSVYLQPPR